MGRLKLNEQYDTDAIIEAINKYQSVMTACFNIHRSSVTLMKKLEEKGQTLKRTFHVEQLPTSPKGYIPEKDAYLQTILETLNKDGMMTRAAATLKINETMLKKYFKDRGLKVYKKWEAVGIQ